MGAMTHVSFSDLQRNLEHHLDEVVMSGEPIVITRGDGKANVVVISERDFGGWQETVHLLSSPRNAEILLASIREADAGQTTAHELTLTEADTEA